MHSVVLGMRVNVISIPGVIKQTEFWVNSGGGYYICVSNVHMCMESHDNPQFRDVVNNADLVIPDGKPLVWAQKLLGVKEAQQVRGMDLMLSLCAYAEDKGWSVGFYGSTPDVLLMLNAALLQHYPNLDIKLSLSPPFRPLSAEEEGDYIARINDSGVKILFVGLGCPKQERWMAEHRDQLNCVMIGVGAAFDFIAGEKQHAPMWMQETGLEWLFRLVCEPR
ncbi:MAG TPA: glycosyltransferase, partial [Chromatiales bacterium]|nr:glycosyltransferase [Chromatiales bacterium]